MIEFQKLIKLLFTEKYLINFQIFIFKNSGFSFLGFLLSPCSSILHRSLFYNMIYLEFKLLQIIVS